MTDTIYLNAYLRNLVNSGAVIETPGEPIWLIAFTGWRGSDPWQPGRWVSDKLEQEEQFFGLLLSHYDQDTDTTWLRIEPACLGMFAENVFGYGVHVRLQELLDLIDNEWNRMHPARVVGDLRRLAQAEAAGRRAYIEGRTAVPGADRTVATLMAALPDGVGTAGLFRAFRRGYDGAAAQAVTKG